MTFDEFTEKNYDNMTVIAYELSRIADSMEYFSNQYVKRLVDSMDQQQDQANKLEEQVKAFSDSFQNAMKSNTKSTSSKPEVEIVK